MPSTIPRIQNTIHIPGLLIICLMLIKKHSCHMDGSSTAMLLSITTPSSKVTVWAQLSIASTAKLSKVEISYISLLYDVHFTSSDAIISSQAVASSPSIILGPTCSSQHSHLQLIVHKTILSDIDHLAALIMVILIMDNPELVLTIQHPHTLGAFHSTFSRSIFKSYHHSTQQ